MDKRLVLQAIYDSPWAIVPAKLAEIVVAVERWAAGERLAPEALAELKAARPAAISPAGGVAVLPIFGSIFPRANLLTETSGGVSAEQLGSALRQALADPAVAAIVLDVNSPGGAVHGVDELSAQIYGARGVKPIVAVANHMAASAAYWLASAADELLVTPSGEVGSIGVFGAHEDVSAALDQAGVKMTLISAGKYKVEGNPYEPLAAEARAALQARIDDFYGMFVKAVARNRAAEVDQVRNGFGEGRLVGAREAVRLGMADRVGSLAEAIGRASTLARGRRSTQAGLDFRQRRARADHV